MFVNCLKKMDTELKETVHYYLNIHGKKHHMNDYIGQEILIKWSGKFFCYCGKEKTKIYRSGFCYNCFWTLPQASPSIFKPELCTAHLDIEERDLEWEKEFQLKPHYVYLANSSGLKVGITRITQGITRWMDQGASQAILFAKVPNRRYSGDIEVALKKHVSDVTNWRKMLSGTPADIDLLKIKNELSRLVPKPYQKFILEDNNITSIKYPVLKFPKKIKSVKLDKSPFIKSKLNGIKGQYLLLEDDQVFNVRAHEGYISEFSVTSPSQELLF